jgi:hypothetical protein
VIWSRINSRWSAEAVALTIWLILDFLPPNSCPSFLQHGVPILYSLLLFILTLAPRAKPKPVSKSKEARVPPWYITHQELSVAFRFESIEAYRKHNRLQNEEQRWITNEKLERAAAASRRFEVGPVAHSRNLRSRVGVQLCFYVFISFASECVFSIQVNNLKWLKVCLVCWIFAARSRLMAILDFMGATSRIWTVKTVPTWMLTWSVCRLYYLSSFIYSDPPASNCSSLVFNCIPISVPAVSLSLSTRGSRQICWAPSFCIE